MADRGEIQDAGKVNPRSDTDDEDATNVETDKYLLPAFQPTPLSTEFSDSELDDDYNHRWFGLNEKHHSTSESAGKRDNDAENFDNSGENGENPVKNNENGSNNVEHVDYIKVLGFSYDDDDENKDDEDDDDDDDDGEDDDDEDDDDEDHHYDANNNDDKVASDEGLEDDNAEQRNAFIRFLERSTLFIRGIVRRTFTYSSQTPRK